MTYEPRGHVPDESLEEYRNLKRAADALDQAYHWYLTKSRNAPPAVSESYGSILATMHDLRVPIAGKK